MQEQYVRVDEMRQVENGLRKSLVSAEMAHQSLEERLQSLAERVQSDADHAVQFEVRLNTALEERLQSYSNRINESFQSISQSYTPITMHREMEQALTNCVPFQNFSDLQKHVQNIQSRLTKLDDAFSDSHSELMGFQGALVAKIEEIVQQCDTLNDSISEALAHESAERNTQMEDFRQRLAAESTDRATSDQQLKINYKELSDALAEANKMRVEGLSQLELRLTAELASSHQQHVASHRELSDAQMEANRRRTEGFNQLESRIKADRESLIAAAKMVEERHDAEIEDLRRRLGAESVDRATSHQQLMAANQQHSDALVEANRIRVDGLSQLELRLKAELAASHQQHMSSLRELADAQSESNKLRVEGFNQLESRFKADQESQNANAKVVEGRHDAEIGNIKTRLASLEPRVESNALQVSSIHGEITLAISRESAGRSAQIEALAQRLELEDLNLSTKLNELAAAAEEQNASHQKLAGSHQQLDASHQQLSKSYIELTGAHQQLRETHGDLAGSHRKLVDSHQELQGSHQELRISHQELQASQKGLQDTHKQLSDAHDHLAYSHGELSGQHRELLHLHDNLNNSHKELRAAHDESRETGQQLIKTEEAIRTRKIEELYSKLDDHHKKLHDHGVSHNEKLASHGEARMRELLELGAKVDEQLNLHNQLVVSHQQLRNSHQELSDALLQTNAVHRDFCSQLEAQFKSEREEKKTLELNIKDSWAKFEGKLTAIEPRFDAALLQVSESLRHESREQCAQLEAVRLGLQDEGAMRSRDLQEIRAKVDDHRVSHEKLGLAHDRLMNSHNELSNGHKARTRDIQEICAKLDDHRVLQEKLGLAHDVLMKSHNELSDAHKNQSSELWAQLEGTRCRLHDEGAVRARDIQEISAKLDSHHALQEKLGHAHHQLMNSHDELSDAHSRTNKIHGDFRSQLEARLNLEREEKKALELNIKDAWARFEDKLLKLSESLNREGREIAAVKLDLHDEGETRARDLKEICAKLDNHRVSQEKLELGLHDEGTMRARDLKEICAKLDNHRVLQEKLGLAHDNLMNSHKELAGAHSKANESHIKSFEASAQKYDAEVSDIRDALQRLIESTGTDRADAEKRWEEFQNKWGTLFSAVEPRVDNIEFQMASLHGELNSGLATVSQKIERTEGSLHAEIGNGLSGLRRHIDETESSLDRAFRAGQAATNADVQKFTSNHKEEARLRQLNMQETYTKHFQDMSQMASKCEELRVEFTNEQKYTRGELQRLNLECPKPLGLIAEVKREAEKMQSQILQQIHGLDNQLKLAEEDQGALRKAHGEHVRTSAAERESNARQITELHADFLKAVAKECADRVTESSGQRAEQSKFIREHIRMAAELRTLLESESKTRAREIEEVSKMLDRKIIDSLDRESQERNAQGQNLREGFESEHAKWSLKFSEIESSLRADRQARDDLTNRESALRAQELKEVHKKLDEHGALHHQLDGSHKLVAASHNELSRAHSEAKKLHEKTCSTILSRLESENAARIVDAKLVQEKYSTEFANIRNTLQRLSESADASHSRTERWRKELESIIHEQQAKCEAKLNLIEPRINTALLQLSSVQGEVNYTLAGWRGKLEDTEAQLHEALNKAVAALHRKIENGESVVVHEQVRDLKSLEELLLGECSQLKSVEEEGPSFKKVPEDSANMDREPSLMSLGSLTDLRADLEGDRVRDGGEQRAQVSKTPQEWDFLKSSMAGPTAAAVSTKMQNPYQPNLHFVQRTKG